MATGAPVACPTASYWQTPPSCIASCVIIVSDITGSCIAYKLLLDDPARSIVILEARQACSGATRPHHGQRLISLHVAAVNLPLARNSQTSDDSSVNPFISARLRTTLAEHFRSENWGCNGERLMEWTGSMGYTKDREPIIGEVPDQKGLFICAGFNGHGLSYFELQALSTSAVPTRGAHGLTIRANLEKLALPDNDSSA